MLFFTDVFSLYYALMTLLKVVFNYNSYLDPSVNNGMLYSIS